MTSGSNYFSENQLATFSAS